MAPTGAGATQGAGQIQGGPGAVGPGSASAWKLDAAGRAGKAPGAGGAAEGQSPSRAVQTQMERGLSAVLRQGGGSLTLHLKPASLGEVRVHMTLEHGAVRARFESANGEARDLMTAGLGALRAALEARGLRVDSLEVAADPHERAERPVAEPPRGAEPHEPGTRQAGDDRGGRSPEESSAEGGDGQGAAREGAEQPGSEIAGHDTGAPEDPADMHTAGDASETLVSLRLDTVA